MKARVRAAHEALSLALQLRSFPAPLSLDVSIEQERGAKRRLHATRYILDATRQKINNK